ncbi:MAG: alpha-xenorhabdolysin family binary toxin subunit A [Blastocatellia bacterium]
MSDKETKINETLSPGKDLKGGIAILAKEEWFKLQAFCDMAVAATTPSTEESMRVSLKLAKDAPLDQDFKETVKLYADLKGYCQTFTIEIKPDTVGLADDIVQYQRRADVIYGRLIGLLVDYSVDGEVSEEKLRKLLEEWKSPNPSADAASIRTNFQTYIERLKKEADERSKKAAALKAKLTTFQSDLKKSESDFKLHFADYTTKYGKVDVELKKLQADIADLQAQLDSARKKQADETIVLATAPLYMLIPFIGPFVMAGVLIGVGVDYGLLIEDLKGKVSQMEEKEKALGPKQTFFEAYKAAVGLTEKTANDIKEVLPLVDRLKTAWDAISSDLGDLSKVMLSARTLSLEEDWDFASIDLETAQKTWKDLKEQADQYRRFATVKAADSVDQLAKGMAA